MRQFAGFGTPEDTNRRYREPLPAGATGLSVAFDLPALLDAVRAYATVGEMCDALRDVWGNTGTGHNLESRI
jgi:methylmalonyl-CoA mutase N-terminal domain/subunit